MALAVKTDKTNYAAGETVTATVTSAAGDRSTTDTLTALSGALAGATVTITIDFPVTLTDTGSRIWTKVSDDGTTAVYTAKA